MEITQLGKFKHALQARQSAAIHDLGANREIIAVERSADELDQTERATEREFAILGLSRRSKLLRNIEAALLRIEDGTFGACVNCEETIRSNRLIAIPWTPFCIGCQEAVDRDATGVAKPLDELDVNAA
jgi:DnaK suppressor protein